MFKGIFLYIFVSVVVDFIIVNDFSIYIVVMGIIYNFIFGELVFEIGFYSLIMSNIIIFVNDVIIFICGFDDYNIELSYFCVGIE